MGQSTAALPQEANQARPGVTDKLYHCRLRVTASQKSSDCFPRPDADSKHSKALFYSKMDMQGTITIAKRSLGAGQVFTSERSCEQMKQDAI